MGSADRSDDERDEYAHRCSTRATSPPSDAFDIGPYLEVSRGDGLGSTVPPSGTMELDDALVLPEKVFLDQLANRARRAELLTALLEARGLTPEAGLRAVQASLGAVVTSAEEAHLASLAALTRALYAAIGALGIAKAPSRSVDVLVFDEDEVSRDLVALTVEAQGHHVRCACSHAELIHHLDERLPDLIITEIEIAHAPAREFCSGLVELLAHRPVPVVFFSGVPSDTLDDLARRTRALAAISKDHGLAALMRELEIVLATL